MRTFLAALVLVILVASAAIAARVYTEQGIVGWRLVVEQDVDGAIRATVTYATTDESGRVLSTESVDGLTLVAGAQRNACRQCIGAIRQASYTTLGLATPTPLPSSTPTVTP